MACDFMDFGFDNDVYIRAMGTKYPLNYEAFRHDFMTLLISKIKAGEEAGKLVQYE